MLALMTYDVSTLVLLVILGFAALTDLRRHRISNLFSIGGIVSGICLQIWGLGIDGLLAGLGGLGVGFLIFIPFYALGGMGAGDVKLMAAVGAFLGLLDTLLAAGLTLAAGSVMGVFVLFYRRGTLVAFQRYGLILKCLATTGQLSYIPPAPGEAAATRFPYALAIFTGTVAALWHLSYLQRLPMMLEWF